MKKALVVICIFFSPLLYKTQEIDLIRIRSLYYKASTSKTDADLFLKTLQTNPGIGASLIVGYTGMVFMLNANFAFNPYNKLNYFIKGKDLLEDAIKTDPKNLELRFLRYCAQTKAPSFLSYNDNISEDKTLLVLNYNRLTDMDLKKRVKDYLQTSKECSMEEKQIFK